MAPAAPAAARWKPAPRALAQASASGSGAGGGVRGRPNHSPRAVRSPRRLAGGSRCAPPRPARQQSRAYRPPRSSSSIRSRRSSNGRLSVSRRTSHSAHCTPASVGGVSEARARPVEDRVRTVCLQRGGPPAGRVGDGPVDPGAGDLAGASGGVPLAGQSGRQDDLDPIAADGVHRQAEALVGVSDGRPPRAVGRSAANRPNRQAGDHERGHRQASQTLAPRRGRDRAIFSTPGPHGEESPEATRSAARSIALR